MDSGVREGVLTQHPVRMIAQHKHLREEQVLEHGDGRGKDGVWEVGSKEGSKGEERVAADEGRLSLGGGEGRRTTINPSPALQLQCDCTKYTGRHGTCSSTLDFPSSDRFYIDFISKAGYFTDHLCILIDHLYNISYQSWSSIAIETFTGIFPVV